MDSDVILKINNITKSFRAYSGVFKSSKKVIKAVDNISLEIKQGTSLGIVGESGSGKTTLANIISDITPPDRGEIFYKGKKIDRRDKNYKFFRRNVQVVFQDPYSSLNPRLKIFTSLKDGLKAHFGKNVNFKDICIETFRKVGLNEDFLFRYPHQFSGGQRQRISIARALVLDPEVIVADEPVSALDVSIQAQILNIFKKLKEIESKTVILISHDFAVVNFLCDYTLVLYKGVDLEYGKTFDIINNPQHPYTKSLISASKGIEEKIEEKNIISVCPFANKCQHYEKHICENILEKKYVTDNHYHRCNKI